MFQSFPSIIPRRNMLSNMSVAIRNVGALLLITSPQSVFVRISTVVLLTKYNEEHFGMSGNSRVLIRLESY